jgi:hypothetical protein
LKAALVIRANYLMKAGELNGEMRNGMKIIMKRFIAENTHMQRQAVALLDCQQFQ